MPDPTIIEIDYKNLTLTEKTKLGLILDVTSFANVASLNVSAIKLLHKQTSQIKQNQSNLLK